jgi:hypothetical protein
LSPGTLPDQVQTRYLLIAAAVTALAILAASLIWLALTFG